MDMLDKLRAQLMQNDYMTTFLKAQLTRMTHLLDKYPQLQLKDEEEERLCDIKVKFGQLTQRDKDMQDFRRIKAKAIGGQNLNQNEIVRLQYLKQGYKRTIKLSEQESSILD